MQRTTIINPSLQAFCFELQEMIQQGWELDEKNPPVMWGIAYETGLTKEDSIAVSKVFNSPPEASPDTPPSFVQPDVAAPRKPGRPKQEVK